ncbi:MAG: hypothetical protein UY91_C0036G0007 [Parcubacteria group bacterium GW2011_GWB1_55_9]|nr:MAG: hypothetical protein UY91_C0036G0007 [Parcubacteria group bacterium GW2011_GWB1_55_9]
MNTNELLSTIEKARRAEDYKSMNVATETLNMRLEGDTSPDAWATRSKMTYELHMAAYQQAKSSLQKSLGLAEQSATEARKAGDVAGELFTQMNTGGLLLPALGKMQEAMALSKKVADEAEALATAATDETEKKRLLRIAANAYYHCIRMTMELHGDPRVLSRWYELKDRVY